MYHPKYASSKLCITLLNPPMCCLMAGMFSILQKCIEELSSDAAISLSSFCTSARTLVACKHSTTSRLGIARQQHNKMTYLAPSRAKYLVNLYGITRHHVPKTCSACKCFAEPWIFKRHCPRQPKRVQMVQKVDSKVWLEQHFILISLNRCSEDINMTVEGGVGVGANGE